MSVTEKHKFKYKKEGNCYGDMMPEMYGRFINYRYKEAFNNNGQAYKQLSLFETSQIFERKGA